MTVLEIYARVNLTTPLEQTNFFYFLNETIYELETMHGNITVGDSQLSKISNLSDSIAIEPLYHTAIADNILFLAGAGEVYKGEFIRKSDLAHKKIWSDNAKGKFVKRNGW